ncbi:MAG TPA: glycoside hydrolase 43 family protein [Bacteroidales bacterium]|nr:glycoside hydrolase 43 family protein [Bacteroidales bacterium]
MKKNTLFVVVLIIFFTVPLLHAQKRTSDLSGGAWSADNGDGTYTNPVLHSDFSDPDVVRVGEDFYMTASSFNCVPGLPVLHSKDLVNWELISYALPHLEPADLFDNPQHGNGIWAPCIRYHNDEFYIFFPDPDHGIYMTKTPDPAGPWSEPVMIKKGKGLIDPAPLWDDDGKAYLAYAFAGSRAGIKSVLVVCTMKPDATMTYNDEVVVFDGHAENRTVEGPKFYKRNGYYYIFAPAGGVATGWQLALRSKNVCGPYEHRTVMAQGKTNINGPHQGAWVTTVTGEDWFIHFQDKGAYGRVVHLNPVVWKNDWPVIGSDKDGDGCGEPVTTFRKPDVGKTYPLMNPPVSDEFDAPVTGLQWQWHGNDQITWGFPSGNLGFYRLNCIPVPEGYKNLWDIPNLFLQKFPAEEFTAECRLTFNAIHDNERSGLVIMGGDYACVALSRENGRMMLSYTSCSAAEKGSEEVTSEKVPFNGSTVYIRVSVSREAVCSFSYSSDGKKYTGFSSPFTAKPGKWKGAKIGFFALRSGITNDAGYTDIDWFRVSKPGK